VTKTTTDPVSPATKALTDAAQATSAAFDAIGAANDDLAAARSALEAANADLLTSVVVKSADPKAAKARIEAARAALKQAEAQVEWCVLKLHAAEVVHEQANADQQAARHAVFLEDYEREHTEFNNPDSRENTLLRQVADNIAELVTLLNDRKDTHDALWSHAQSLPPDQRPVAKAGKPILSAPTRGIPVSIGTPVPQEIIEAVRHGLQAGDAELTERRRAAQYG
jgi:hypothetical protein